MQDRDHAQSTAVQDRDAGGGRLAADVSVLLLEVVADGEVEAFDEVVVQG